jgi:enhancer of yellow 2 transcription factor
VGRLKDLLRQKLTECGWKDDMRQLCKGGFPWRALMPLTLAPRGADLIKSKGLEQVTVDDLVAEVTPKGRASVPDSVKAELLQRIRKFLTTS